MGSFLMGLLIAFCFIAAAGVTLLRVVFMRITVANMAEWQGRRLHEMNTLRKLVAKQDSVLSALRFGYITCMVAAIVLMTHSILMVSSPLQMIVCIVLLTVCTILLTESLPKSFALKQNDDVLLRFIPAVLLTYYVFIVPCYIVTQLFGLLTASFKTAFFHLDHLENTSEYFALVNRDIAEKTVFDSAAQKEQQVQKNLAAFTDQVVEQYMIPVSDIELIDGSQPMEELVETVMESSAQRMLVFQDEPDNIFGVLHTRMLVKAVALCDGDKNSIDLSSAISEPWFISPTTPVLEQIEKFQQRGDHFALVRDRQNNLKGAVSLETLLEKMAQSFR